MHTGGGLLLACAGCGLICERALLARERRARLAELKAGGWRSLSGGTLGGTQAAAADGADGADGRAEGAETETWRAEGAAGAEGAEGEGRLPVGLLLVVFGASQAQRLASLPGHRSLCVCGVPRDLKV